MISTNWSKTQKIALTGMFGAIIFLLMFTPLGFLQLPVISATIIHIPVIIGAILLGPKYGAVLGFMFGLASFIFASTLSVTLTAFAFTPLRPVPGTDNGSPWALLVAFVPRILVGVVSPLVFYGLMKVLPKKLEGLGLIVAAVAGSMTNTILVLNLMFLIFRESWGYAVGSRITYSVVAGAIGSGGVMEAIVAGVIVPSVCLALFAVSRRLAPRRA